MEIAPLTRRLLIGGTLATLSLIGVVAAQQPVLLLTPRAFSRQSPPTSLGMVMTGPGGNIFALVADVAPGRTTVLGGEFDLAFSPSLLALSVGVLTGNYQQSSLPLVPSSLPASVPIYCQYGTWDVAQGFSTMQASNLDSFVGHDGTGAVTFNFSYPGYPAYQYEGTFDKTVYSRLQALPAVVRTVRPLPPEAYPSLITSPLEPLHPSGARFQFAIRASDLGANGIPETLTAIRWKPQFGVVATESFTQFELLAGHSSVVPDYSIDPWSALPAFPFSGLDTQFAQNQSSAPLAIFSGSYTVQPQALQASGYMPFPSLQQPFVYDGQSTLLLETQCAANASGGTPANHQSMYSMVLSAPTPHATVFAAAGLNGIPSPMQPGTTAAGTGASILPDWELEFVRTTSVVTSPFRASAIAAPDYLAPIVAAYTPPGTSISIEYRGQASGTSVLTAWSSSPDIADGMLQIQFRVRMESNPVTGAVPWIDALSIPYQ
ncbi:MAG: hypothetical protein ACI85K_000351 [Hyphomicrobiaceae bacterium]|jgi:hypothetical protein